MNYLKHISTQVSDHGMSQVKSKSDYIALNTFLNMDRIDKNKTIYGEVSHIYTTSKDDVIFILYSMILYSYLTIWQKENDVYLILRKIPNTKTYLKDNIPDEFHFKANDRIGNLSQLENSWIYFKRFVF